MTSMNDLKPSLFLTLQFEDHFFAPPLSATILHDTTPLCTLSRRSFFPRRHKLELRKGSPFFVSKTKVEFQDESQVECLSVNPKCRSQRLLNWMGSSPVRISNWSMTSRTEDHFVYRMCFAYGKEIFTLLEEEEDDHFETRKRVAPFRHFLCIRSTSPSKFKTFHTLYSQSGYPYHHDSLSVQGKSRDQHQTDFVGAHRRAVGWFTSNSKGNTFVRFDESVPPLVCLASLRAIIQRYMKHITRTRLFWWDSALNYIPIKKGVVNSRNKQTTHEWDLVLVSGGSCHQILVCICKYFFVFISQSFAGYWYWSAFRYSSARDYVGFCASVWRESSKPWHLWTIVNFESMVDQFEPCVDSKLLLWGPNCTVLRIVRLPLGLPFLNLQKQCVWYTIFFCRFGPQFSPSCYLCHRMTNGGHSPAVFFR